MHKKIMQLKEENKAYEKLIEENNRVLVDLYKTCRHDSGADTYFPRCCAEDDPGHWVCSICGKWY